MASFSEAHYCIHSDIDIINNKARYNQIDAKKCQMAFRSVPTNPYLESLVMQNWCDFRGLCLHSTSVVILPNTQKLKDFFRKDVTPCTTTWFILAYYVARISKHSSSWKFCVTTHMHCEIALGNTVWSKGMQTNLMNWSTDYGHPMKA